MSLDKLSLLGIVVFGYHGFTPEEQKLGQRFIIDVHLYGNYSEAAATDNLDKGVNYASVFERVLHIAETERHKLLESLAHRLCTVILTEFRRVEEVTVKIKKPSVPLPGALEAAEVELHRKRN